MDECPSLDQSHAPAHADSMSSGTVRNRPSTTVHPADVRLGDSVETAWSRPPKRLRRRRRATTRRSQVPRGSFGGRCPIAELRQFRATTVAAERDHPGQPVIAR